MAKLNEGYPNIVGGHMNESNILKYILFIEIYYYIYDYIKASNL